MSGFFATLFRQKYINRWGLMRNAYSENLTEHAFEVSVLSHALCAIGNSIFGRNYDCDRAATLALFHDVPEVFTGDLPTPVKYMSKDVHRTYGETERFYTDKLISSLPEGLKEIYSPLILKTNQDERILKIIKAADKLAAYIKCIEECGAGNHDFKTAKLSIEKSLSEMDCPELDYFIEKFLPAFGMTLDELQEENR